MDEEQKAYILKLFFFFFLSCVAASLQMWNISKKTRYGWRFYHKNDKFFDYSIFFLFVGAAVFFEFYIIMLY